MRFPQGTRPKACRFVETANRYDCEECFTVRFSTRNASRESSKFARNGQEDFRNDFGSLIPSIQLLTTGRTQCGRLFVWKHYARINFNPLASSRHSSRSSLNSQRSQSKETLMLDIIIILSLSAIIILVLATIFSTLNARKQMKRDWNFSHHDPFDRTNS